MMTVIIYKGEDAKIGADIALKHKLYVSGWLLSGELKSQRKHGKGRIAIHYDGNMKPVGVVNENEEGILMAFVRKSERKKGYGRNMVNAIKTDFSKAYTGIDRSAKIWKLNGVSVII
jgi:hypothetical protein